MDIQEKSYWHRQKLSAVQAEERQIRKLVGELESIMINPSDEEEIEEKKGLEVQIPLLTNAKRRDAQRKLDRWKDEHQGQQWIRAEEAWKRKLELVNELKGSKQLLEHMKENKAGVDVWIRVLQKAGFLDATESTKLTTKGVLATECNEGHALLCSEFFVQGGHKDLTGEELVTLFACFIEEKVKDETPSIASLNVPKAVKDAMMGLDGIVQEFQGFEHQEGIYSPDSYWTLCTTWVEPVWRWLQGDHASAICTDHGLFEGNFVRSVLRVTNIVEEWVSMGTYMADVELLEKLEAARANLVRDFLKPDSLYLHL
jgi:superfamily II RNA helicase